MILGLAAQHVAVVAGVLHRAASSFEAAPSLDTILIIILIIAVIIIVVIIVTVILMIRIVIDNNNSNDNISRASFEAARGLPHRELLIQLYFYVLTYTT